VISTSRCDASELNGATSLRGIAWAAVPRLSFPSHWPSDDAAAAAAAADAAEVR